MKRGGIELSVHPRHELTTRPGAKMEWVAVRDASNTGMWNVFYIKVMLCSVMVAIGVLLLSLQTRFMDSQNPEVHLAKSFVPIPSHYFTTET